MRLYCLVGLTAASFTACAPTAEECFELGALDCADGLSAAPGGSATCQANYLDGYDSLCATGSTSTDSSTSSSSSSSSGS